MAYIIEFWERDSISFIAFGLLKDINWIGCFLTDACSKAKASAYFWKLDEMYTGSSMLLWLCSCVTEEKVCFKYVSYALFFVFSFS